MNIIRKYFFVGLSSVKEAMSRPYSSGKKKIQNILTLVGKVMHNVLRGGDRQEPVFNTIRANPEAILRNAAKHIVWVDMEMTGLDIDQDHILEIACLVTDAELNVVATGPNLIIHQPDKILNSMGEWCVAQHGESGLTEASRKSVISLTDAENVVFDFLKSHVPEKKCPLGGNSVYMDRLFLRKYMPKVDQFLHYRIIDVSTIKELGRRWYQKEFSKMPIKKFSHRAVDDILESIEELKYFRNNIFKS